MRHESVFRLDGDEIVEPQLHDSILTHVKLSPGECELDFRTTDAQVVRLTLVGVRVVSLDGFLPTGEINDGVFGNIQFSVHWQLLSTSTAEALNLDGETRISDAIAEALGAPGETYVFFNHPSYGAAIFAVCDGCSVQVVSSGRGPRD